MTILVLYEQFLGKVSLKFLPPNLSVPPTMIHFVMNFQLSYVYFGRKALFVAKIKRAFSFSVILKSVVTINAPSLISDEENLNAWLRFSTFVKVNNAMFQCLLASHFGL